jgi:OOP family OmpA-OmpF porin
MMKAIVMACALVVPAVALPMLASADEAGQWYVNPNFGGVSVDNERPVQDKDWLYGLGIGRHVNRWLSTELNVTGAQVGGGPGRSDLSQWASSVDLLGVLNREGWVAPYVSVGAGVLSDEPSPGKNSTDFMSQAGVGLFIKLWQSTDGSRSFSLRPDVKARWDDAGANGKLRDSVGTLGFQFAFGGAKAAPTMAALPPPPVAPPPPPPAPPPPIGDSDHDGVLDNQDQCPDTPAGVAVDLTGCPRKGSVVLDGVTFEVNSANLTGPSGSVLGGVALDLKKYPRLRIELQGHTDSTGSDAYNLKLSQQRADSVRTRLIEDGVTSTQLVAKGYGESMPVESNDTPDGRAHNRRVVMSVIENPGDVEVKGAGKAE